MNRDRQLRRALPRRAVQPPRGWLALLALAVGCAVFAALALRPAAALGEARGLYAPEASTPPFRWTSSRVLISLSTSGRPVGVTLELAAGRWPNRPSPLVMLRADDQLLARFMPDDRPRRYHLLLPSSADALVLESSVDRPARGDRRWLGVQLHALTAQAFGPPAHAVAQALLAALASLPLGLALWWCLARGWGAIAAVTALGLVLRVYELDRLPAGFFQDEAVSLVDAWNLAHTGHDHLGHLLPLGAFESFGDWVSPLLTFLEVPTVVLLGTTPLAGRLVVALAGTLTIPVIYAIARMLRLPVAGALCAALVAALSPWQILRSRVAGPPSAALLPWTLCVLAALLLLQRGGRRQALLLALAAGVGISAYPTMKLAVPLLVALTLLLALAQELSGEPRTPNARALQARAASRWSVRGRRWAQAMRCLAARWWPAALLLVVLWLPFAQVTLLNEVSAMRAIHKVLRADSATDWLAQWLRSYRVYLQPAFYFSSGDAANGIPDLGVQLPVEAPLVLVGLAALLWHCIGWQSNAEQQDQREQQPTMRGERRVAPRRAAHTFEWWLVLGALLIAPLPASLMTPNPHLSRALIVAPVYALLVGLGLATLWSAVARWSPARLRTLLPPLAAAALLAAIGWQGVARFQDYRARYPLVVARKYQDGLREAVERTVVYAPQFDEVWLDDRMSFPYVYVLAAQALPATEAQATIVVQRPRTTFNTVTQVGKYRFTSLKKLPLDLPVVEATANSLGAPGYLIQRWQQGGKHILVLRRM